MSGGKMKNLIQISMQMKDDIKKWYHIKATHSTIGVIRFWLYQKNEDDVRKLVIKKGYTDIEWIKQEIPPFIG